MLSKRTKVLMGILAVLIALWVGVWAKPYTTWQKLEGGLIVMVIFDKDGNQVGGVIADRVVVFPDGRIVYRDAKSGQAFQINPGMGVMMASSSKTVEAKVGYQ